jgi:hypothetical protein
MSEMMSCKKPKQMCSIREETLKFQQKLARFECKEREHETVVDEPAAEKRK